MKEFKELIFVIRRWWAIVSQPHIGIGIRTGDWQCIYPDGGQTRWISYGDAINTRDLSGGKVRWREDPIPDTKSVDLSRRKYE